MQDVKSLSSAEVGKIFSCTARTVRKHYQEFGGVRIGRKYHFSKAKVLEIFEAREGGKIRKSSDPHVPTIKRWLEAYVEECERRFDGKTHEEKRRIKDAFIAYLEETDGLSPDDMVQSFDRVDARLYFAFLYDLRGPSGSNKARKHLSAAWNWGESYLDRFPDDKRNPFQACKRYAEKRRPRYIPPEEDFWKVYNSADKYDKAILELFLCTAARRCEIFRLEWDDINFQNNTIRLYTRKTKNGEIKYSQMPMNDSLKQTLLWLYEHKSRKCNKVLTHNGLPYNKGLKLMPRLCKQANLRKPFTFHAIRHLCATLLYKEGFSIFEIQHLLRHEKQSTTVGYLHSLGAFEAVARVMDSLSKRRINIRKFLPEI